MKKSNLLAVSVIAVMATVSAYADIASTAYVTTAVSSKQDKLSGTEGNIVTYGATDGAVSSLNVQKAESPNADADEDAAIPTVAYARELANTVAGNYVATEQADEDSVLVTDNGGQVVTSKITDTYVDSNAAISTGKLAIPTGWSKGSSTAALGVGDSVSTALGKLENKVDNAVVKNDAITGATKAKITYDAKGLVTSGADLEASDIPSLATSKINALTSYTKGTSAEALAATDTLNAALSKLENQIDAKQASGSYVTTSTTVNTKPLSSNVTLSGADIAATGYAKASAAEAVAATDSLNDAIGKLEYKADNAVVKNDAITGATKAKITYDAKGLVTGGADLEASDIPSLATSKINALTSYTKGTSAEALAATDTLNAALSKLENQIDAKQASGSYVTTSSVTNSYSATGTAPVTGTAVASAIAGLDGVVDTNHSTGNVVTGVSQTDGVVTVSKGYAALQPAAWTPDTDGTYVLTASKSGDVITYHWESIGRAN